MTPPDAPVVFGPPPERRGDATATLPDGLLPARSLEILALRYGLREPHGAPSRARASLDAIGRKFGLGRERVRQIVRDALAKLDSPAARAALGPLRDRLLGALDAAGGTATADEVRAVARPVVADGSDPAAWLLLLSEVGSGITVYRGLFSRLPREKLVAIERDLAAAAGGRPGPLPVRALLDALPEAAPETRRTRDGAARRLIGLLPGARMTERGEYLAGDEGLVRLVESEMTAAGPCGPAALARRVNQRLLPGSRVSPARLRALLRQKRIASPDAMA